jgi:hypothetical protein
MMVEAGPEAKSKPVRRVAKRDAQPGAMYRGIRLQRLHVKSQFTREQIEKAVGAALADYIEAQSRSVKS